MLDFGFYNMDCMDGMKEFPDGFFDLAIVDPPYGINVGQMNMGACGGVAPDSNRSAKNYMPFGGKNSGGGVRCKSEERTHSAGEIQVGEGFFTTPKYTRHSTTVTRRMPHISKN